MDDKRAPSGFPNVLRKLGAMTAIRDTHLVEQSLLRTLGPLLGVLDTSFYRADEKGNLISALHHSLKVVLKGEARSTVENVEEITNVRDIPETLMSLFDSVRVLGKSCSSKIEGDLHICYPIRSQGELVAFFIFRREKEVTPVEDAIIHGVLEVFTNYFALLDTSQRDQLTGLLNRYSLESNLDRLWNLISARRHLAADGNNKRSPSTETYWLGVLDIDHFKKVNDTYGHIIGDEVLILTSNLLKASLRQSDLLTVMVAKNLLPLLQPTTWNPRLVFLSVRDQKLNNFRFRRWGESLLAVAFAVLIRPCCPRRYLTVLTVPYMQPRMPDATVFIFTIR